MYIGHPLIVILLTFFQVLDTLQPAETIYNPNYTKKPLVDPELVADRKARKLRVSSSKLSMQIGERTTNKSMARMHEWRNSIMVTERKRLRKTVLNLCVVLSQTTFKISPDLFFFVRREHHRQVSRLNEGTLILVSERGPCTHPGRHCAWRLDENEGPYRIRFVGALYPTKPRLTVTHSSQKEIGASK